jgi:hypothetical protein
MPWFAVPVAIATIGFVGKLVSRHIRGQLASQALEDPPGVRTIAHFELDERTTPADVLLAVAAELARDQDQRVEVTADAVRSRPHPLAGRVDAVRLARRDGGARARAYTLELTRAWTGAMLDDDALALLLRVHDALVSLPGIQALAWHARQDRSFTEQHVFPIEAPPAPV